MGNGEDLVRRFESLKKRNDQLKSEKIVLETKISSKTEELNSIEKEIFEKFKVKTVEEAKQLLESRKVELKEKLEKLEEKMAPFDNIVSEGE